jgi:hypothetical protein
VAQVIFDIVTTAFLVVSVLVAIGTNGRVQDSEARLQDLERERAFQADLGSISGHLETTVPLSDALKGREGGDGGA